MSPNGTAAITASGSAPDPAVTARTRNGSSRPRRTPETTSASPASARCSSSGRSSGVSRSAVAEPATTRCWASTTWMTWVPETGIGSGSRSVLTRAATSWALARASLSTVRLSDRVSAP